MEAKNKYLEKTIQFIESIGIQVVEKELDDTTFLPGLTLGINTVYVDYSKLKYPGDILHEAAHIAVSTPQERELIGTAAMPDTWPSSGDEIAAILWSYAALKHLDLPIEFVFHPDGYKDQSEWLIENFNSSNFIGLPLLQWYKMTPSLAEIAEGSQPFPAMVYWMRQD